MEALRDRILNTDVDCQDQDMRIIIKAQNDLWADGVRAGAILGDAELAESAEETDSDADDEATEATESPDVAAMNGMRSEGPGEYRAGKWGRYVRRPMSTSTSCGGSAGGSLRWGILPRFASASSRAATPSSCPRT